MPKWPKVSNKAAKAAKKVVTDAKNVHGNGLINITTSTNAGGLYVVDSYDIDTSLVAQWSTISAGFEQWRIKTVKFEYVPNTGTNTLGTVVLSTTDDPDESSPGTLSDQMALRNVKIGAGWMRFSLTYHPLMKGWRYCRDQVTSDDRWEMPGVFQIGTTGFTTAGQPGRVQLHYVVEFRGTTNTTVGMKDYQPLTREQKLALKQQESEEAKGPGKNEVLTSLPSYDDYLDEMRKKLDSVKLSPKNPQK
jgi:hypothetical protein